MDRSQLTLDLGRAPEAETFAAEAIEDHIEAAVADASGVAIDFDALEAEFDAQGALSEESYALLAAAGIPRPVVDRHIEGRLAANEMLRREILEIVGGPERYWRMTEWARAALSPMAFAQYEAALVGEPEVVKAVVEDLSDVYAEATGDAAEDATAPASMSMATPKQVAAPKQMVERKSAQMTEKIVAPAPRHRAAQLTLRGQRFTSTDQLAKAIRDPRYRSDPAYRAWVAETVAQSDLFSRADKA